MDDLYFEDFAPGRSFRTPGATLSEAQILDFAFAYDPQPFHLDKVAAGNWGYDGLIASGLQTLCISFRLFLQSRIINACSLGSPGMDELRWLKPVRPGDTIHTLATVEKQRQSRSKPDRGLVHMRYQVFNQDGEPVMSWIAVQILRKRSSL
ncbi:MAG: MaoC family dehydratase [Rhodospirillales bacterium]|nr:MaoC family dehydratase [Rhodospirillales bacterium]